jgi:hypothetical protein
MARLSESDRRILLGENFDELERQFAEESRAPVTPEEKRKALEKAIVKNRDRRFTAFGLVATGGLMTWGSYHRAMGVDLALWAGVAIGVVGLIFYAWLVVTGRTLQQSWDRGESLPARPGALPISAA